MNFFKSSVQKELEATEPAPEEVWIFGAQAIFRGQMC